MNLFAGQTRDQLRGAYAAAWRKHRAGGLLTPLEAMIADVIALHPEFQPLLEAPDGGAAVPASASPAENPFLHMGLHLAVRDHVSIDRPRGLRELREQLQARCGDAHAAEHELMQALGETLRGAQRSGRPPQEQEYLERARQRHAALAARGRP